LGLGNTGTFNNYGAGPSYYPIHLGGVICNGNETNILACEHLQLGDEDYTHAY